MNRDLLCVPAIMVFLFSIVSGTLFSEETPEEIRDDYAFVAHYREFRRLSGDRANVHRPALQLELSRKLAEIYFRNTDATLQNRFITFLKEQYVNGTPELREDYVALGKGFYDYAKGEIEKRRVAVAQNRVLFTVSGALVGIVSGAASYHFGLPMLERRFGTAFKPTLLKALSLYGGGLVLGTAGGYAGSNVFNAIVLPFTTKDRTSLYFCEQFESGDAFVADAFQSERVAMALNEANETVAALQRLRAESQ